MIAEKLILKYLWFLACRDSNFKCYNGGTCTNFAGSPRCDCPAETYGKSCEIGKEYIFWCKTPENQSMDFPSAEPQIDSIYL